MSESFGPLQWNGLFSEQIRVRVELLRDMGGDGGNSCDLWVCGIHSVWCNYGDCIRVGATFGGDFSTLVDHHCSLPLHRDPDKLPHAGIWAHRHPQSWWFSLGCCLSSAVTFLSHLLPTFPSSTYLLASVLLILLQCCTFASESFHLSWK